MITVGSVCSGIEAASVAWEPLGMEFKWFSEIAEFPSLLLKDKYPNIPNLGDMNSIPEMIKNSSIDAPDLICGGTPCQAFSFAGYQNGLNDERGNLTLTFVDIINSNDFIRKQQNKSQTIIFYENVEGILKDKTNAFGLFISALAGLDAPLELSSYPSAGILKGKNRNVAWRVLDAKYFGVPQQRKRVYLVAGGKDFRPELVLFEKHLNQFEDFPKTDLVFNKDGQRFEVFREYTDCLYSSYGTKWNGNAAAYNGSLFIVQNERLRRLSPLECERLMGFPDNYTNILNSKNTPRYQAIGNSWAVPVVAWLGKRIIDNLNSKEVLIDDSQRNMFEPNYKYIDLSEGKGIYYFNGLSINCSSVPEKCKFANIKDIVDPNAPESIYISPVGCYGILRRKTERNLRINKRLETVLTNISSSMNMAEIDARSRVQKRGRFSV